MLLFGALALATPVVPAAAIEAGGSITGRVIDSASHPVADVNVYAAPTVSGGSYGYATTDIDGLHTITGLESDSYRVRSRHCRPPT